MTRPPLPTRTLRERPDLNQLKRQAKELLESFKDGESAAVAEVNAHYHGADPSTFALHDAQLVIARAYGFESWPKLKAFVDGATVKRLIDAVRSRNVDDVRSLLNARPELARMSHANLQVLHYAVLENAPNMVRILMAHDGNAREGVYPYREATTAYAIAQRGYDDIVRIIEEEEQKRRDMRSGMRGGLHLLSLPELTLRLSQPLFDLPALASLFSLAKLPLSYAKWHCQMARSGCRPNAA